jgi:hypothetical protein
MSSWEAGASSGTGGGSVGDGLGDVLAAGCSGSDEPVQAARTLALSTHATTSEALAAGCLAETDPNRRATIAR